MKIIHIHPSSKMSNKFVIPLMETEKQLGYHSKLINFKNDKHTSKNKYIDLSITNLFLLIDIIKFIFYVRKNSPDLIFCHNSFQSILPITILRFIGFKKIIYFNHGVTFLGYHGIIRLFFYFIEKCNVLMAYKTITVSEEMKKYLKEFNSDITLINNGSACGIKLSNKNLKKKNTCYENMLIISYIGRLEKRKGAKVLLKILEHFAFSNKVQFLFCGFSEKQFYKFAGKKFKNLKCLGFIDKVDEILQISDILLLPSLHEGMPYSVLEAMVNEALVLGNDIPGIRSLIKDKHNGFLVKNNDINIYVRLINEICLGQINVKKITKKSLKIVKKFERGTFMISYKKFLKSVI